MIVHQCTGLGPWRHGWVKLVWKNLTEPHSFVTSTKRTPLPWLHWKLWARPSRPASVSDLTKVLLEDWPKISINTLPNLMGSLPLSCKGLEDIILNPVDKEYDVTQWLYVCENRQQMAICKIGKWGLCLSLEYAGKYVDAPWKVERMTSSSFFLTVYMYTYTHKCTYTLMCICTLTYPDKHFTSSHTYDN